MKRIISLLISLLVIGALIFVIYKFFFDCEKTNTLFNKNFVLEQFDYATVEEEVIVKLLQIKDNRCKEEECDKEGQLLVKLLVINDRKISYVELGSLDEEATKIKNYVIELIEVDEESAKLKINRTE